MSFTYRYTGDVPTAFVALRKNDQTWVPEKGDEITVNRPVGHPLLERVDAVSNAPSVDEPDAAPTSSFDKRSKKSFVPTTSELSESATTADASQEN